MNPNLERAEKELARARRALKAAQVLLHEELFDDCVSRAYYTVLHAAKAALSLNNLEADSHEGVKRMFGLSLVKPGMIEKEYAKIIVIEQEDRELGDYGFETEIEESRARQRVCDAERFLHRMEIYARSQGVV